MVLFVGERELALLGQRGDTFGILNALFSGLSLLGVILAIHYQRSELQEQREELKQARIAQQQIAIQQIEQAKFAKMQTEIEACRLMTTHLSREIVSIEKQYDNQRGVERHSVPFFSARSAELLCLLLARDED